MFPYWVLFALPALGAVQNQAHVRRLGGIGVLMVAFGLMMMLMIGLRFEVGGDWLNYERIYENTRYAQAAQALSQGDPAYSFLNWAAVQLGYGVWFVNICCAAIFSWGLMRFSAQQLNPWLAIVVAIPYLVIVVSMGYTRQAVAIGLIMAGLAAMRRDPSIVRFGFYILAAALFHRTAIIILPLVAMAATRNRWIMLAVGGVGAAMLFYFLVNATFDTMVQNYLIAEYDAQGAFVRVLMNVLPAALFLLFQRRFSLDEADRRLWRNFAWAALAALALLIVLRSSVVVDRMALYIIPLQLAVLSRLPFALSSAKSRSQYLLTLAVIAYSAVVQFTWLNAADNANYWLPYKTIIL